MLVRFTRHFLSGAVCALALSAIESSMAFAQSPTSGGAATTAQTQSAPPTLSGFIQDTLSQMGLPQNASLAGLSDAAASATLGAVQQLDTATATTTIQMRGVTFDIVRFTPTGSQQPLLVLHAPQLRLSNLIPAAAGTPIDALGSLDDVTFVYAGSQPPQTFSAPQVALADGTTLPGVITKLQALAQSRMPLKSGMNMAATLPLSGISQEIAGVLRAVGINPSSRLPLRGGISPAIFKEAFSTAPSLPSRGLQPTAQQKTAIANLLRTYGQDFINNLDLSASVPSTTSIGPFTVSGESFTLKGDGQGGMSFGFAAQELKAFAVDITDALFTYDADTKAIVANGTVNAQTLTDALGFNGLSVDNASLASTYAQNAWAFAVNGQGKINNATLSFAVSSATQPGGSPVISASLDGGQQGISAADIAGRSIPGFNNIKLSKVEVSAERIVADMTFGRNNVPGEIAAFHVGNATTPTLALTVDTIGFGDLVPGAVGTAMDGVAASGLTMMIVPPNAPTLAPTDTAIPTHVQANLKKVIDDAAQHDSSRASTTFAPGFHVLADLNLQGSQAMGDLMKSAGVSETVIPIIGQVSASTFQSNAPKADAIKGLNLSVALPALRIPGLPETITAASPIFAVTETAPAALADAAGAGLQGPFVSIGLDLQMQAGAGTHDFKALMMVGKNAQGGRVIDLTGSAADPKDLFEFKGLSVTSLDMASVFDAGAWDFKVNGAAALNGAALTFDTEVKRVDGKVEYVATLTGGQGGISAKDVAGRDIPGFDAVALTKVVVTGGRLVADLAYGPKRTPGEIAAFHVGTQTNATMAITLDKLAFAELVPGSVGSALDGVEIDGLTLMIVPQGGDGLRPDDPAVPTHIQDNLKKVIADAATHDPTKANTTLGAGFNFLADLDIKGSQGMGDLMKSAGLSETVVPIIGQVSNATFQPNVPKAQSLSGLRLDVALPDLKIPGLPDTITIAKPVFAITDTAPDALTAAASEVAKGDLQAPFVTIGADVQMKAGPGTHDFASVLMVGKDAQGKRVVDLVGSATDPKGLFDFKGLAVKSLDLASIYNAGNWDFKLNGSADLNKAALTFDTEIKRIDNKVTYVATLDGGQNGISAKDVAGRDVPGLDQVALTKVVVTEDRLVADMTFGSKKTPGELAAFHVGNQANATMAFTLDKLAFADLVPGSAGSAMDGVEVDGLSLVVVPSGGAGLKPDDPAVPAHIADNLKKVIADAAKNDPAKATYTLGDGFNLLADLDLKASGGMGDLMASAGVTETMIPVVGQISSATFQPNVPKADSIKGLNLEVALPALKVPGLPDTITITDAVFKVAETAPAALTAAASEVAKGDLQAPFVTIGADLQMKAGPGTHDFASVLMVGKDAQGKRVVDLVGSATDPKGLFEFKGLTVKSLDLASIYDAGSWDFKLNGSADLNSAALTFDTEIKRIDNKVTYVATLDGGTTGISAKDVAGRDVPGLDQVALTKVVVTEDRLVADMAFGPKKTPGELAAFHVGNQANATMAFTLDKLAFADLVPGSAGSALDGVEVDGLSLLIVPQGASALKPDDAAVPQHIADNLKKVIADAAQHDASKATYALPAGFNLLADLDIKASGGMGDLMASAGVTETVIPVVGTVSASTFVPNVPKADSVKGINLEVALPDLKVPGLPDTITIAKPIFKITETAPEALTAAASGIAKGDLQAPFVTIGADLQMQAGQGTHDFASLLMVGKDAQGKRVIDLVGSATDPKGLFEFKGLTVKSLDLASIYDAGSWDFKLNGSADLNSAALTFDTEIKRVDNKVTYVATLDGGQNGISAKDVAGRDVPGFDTVALTKVTVTGDRLIADLTFGPRNTAGEVAAFHPAGADHAVMAVTLDKLGFADVLPSAAGGTLDGVEIDNLAMVIVPQKNAGLKPDDASIPEHIRDNVAKVLTDAAKHDASKQDHTMKAGFNLFADLDLKASGGMGDLMKSAGVTETIIPIVGTISRSTFNPKAPKKDALAGLDLNVALPDLKVPGLPDTMTISNPMFSITENAPEALTAAATTLASAAPQAPFISIGAGLKMQAGQGEHDFDALLMVAKDAQGKRLIDLLGSAKDPKGLFEFKGLTVTTLDLASVYDAGAWDFKLDGTADLNGASVNFDTEVRKVGGQTTYIATLSAANGISAKDVAGREVPGFDSLALTKVIVTGDSLTADMTFGPKKTAGEIAAFHPQGADKAVMGITLAKLGFAELVPVGSGAPLNGVDVADLTIVVVPEKSAGLKHDDAAIPEEIRTNLTKVLTDAGKASGYTLKKDINLFADLELGQSQAMQDFMDFIGKDGKKPLPIVGVMSPQLFNPKAPSAQRFAGMDLAVPMPNLNLSGLPNAFQLKNTEFKITDATPGGQQALWVGLQADMDADLLGSNLAFKTDVGFAKGEISLSATSEQELKKPFGIQWLDLKQLALALDYDKKAKSGDLKFTAIPAKPFGKSTPEIEIELQETAGKLSAGVLKIKDKVAFSDLPILNKVKHADKFDFTFLEISTSGVSGGSELHGEKVDVAVFEHNAKWTFAVSDNGGGKGFKFDRIMPALSKTPLKDFHLNDAALIFSETDINGKVSDLPGVAQTVFSEIYGSTSAAVIVKNGITVAANFSPGASSGFAAKGLQGVGIHDDILIEGSVVNIFGEGAPGVDILVDTPQGPGGSKGASHTPKMAKFPGQVGFFVQYQADELDVGLEADIVLHLPKKQKLDLVTKLELELNDKGFAVDIFMDLKGQWKDPFGINGIELDEVALKFGIDMEDEAVFGFKAKTILADGAEKIDIAAEMDFELDAAGLPDGVAMKGSISELGIPAIIDVAERLAGGKSNIVPVDHLPLPEFKDVTFAFATPGVSDPQLGLIGSGFALGGELFFLNRELGKVDLSAGTSGIKMDAAIDPIDFKVLKLDKNTFKMDLGFKGAPKLNIDSEIEFLGAKQTVLVAFDDGMLDMTFEEKIGGGIWDSKITLGMGIDAAHHGEPDIFVQGIIKEDFFKWLRDQAPAQVHKFFNQLNADFEKAKAKIDSAKQKVHGLDSKIAARKAVVQREKANADAAVQRAENRVRSVQNDANNMANKARYHGHRCKWYRAWECAESGYFWARYGVEEAAYHVALGVLQAAQATVDHLPSELMDPQLTALESERGIALGALDLAKLAIDGVEDADKWIDKGLESLLRDIGKTNALVIKEIFFEADLDGMIKGEPAILTMDLEIFGADLGTQMFAFKITDPVFDAEQLLFIPLHMVSELFEKYVPKSLKKIVGPVITSINKASSKAEAKVYQELKSVPGLNLPPDIKAALDQLASLETGPKDWDYASVHPDHQPLTLRRSHRHGSRIDVAANDNQAGWIQLAQATAPANDNVPAATTHSGVPLKPDPKANHVQRLEDFKKKKQDLMLHIITRNKPFGEKLMQFEQQQEAERKKNENDEFVAYTDIKVPPGVLFTEKLLVARHSKLCLGQNAANKTTFHPCSDNPGGLLWSTRQRLLDTSGKLIPYNEAFATKWPGRVYTQLLHNGLCLTTPFHLAAYDQQSRNAHLAQLQAVASKHPSDQDAHLSLAACRNDGRGQLWKVVKDTHDQDGVHGFKLQERDSAYCLRPGQVAAHTKKTTKEVNGVFFPCSGVAHGTFELTTPNADMPVWYDHNGVIKSDNGYCLDVANDPTAAADSRGSIVFLKSCDNDEYDRWDYVVEYDKTVKIVNDFTGYCLYPYDKAEGAIPSAQQGQLVQRPCDGRYGQNWKMRIIPQQKWFQLEALNNQKQGTNTCMVADQRHPGQTQVNVFMRQCNPATRGRWEFGHWKGTYQWAEWTIQNTQPGGSENLSEVFWVSADDLKVKDMIGVCRVIIGDQNTGNHSIYAGTWRGTQCGYVRNNQIQNLDPSQPDGGDIVVEVLTGLDIGVQGATGSWRSSTSGVPIDSQGQNKQPPAPTFSAFLVGGDQTHTATYLCRVKQQDKWHYGYQASGLNCQTDAGPNITNDMQVLVFATVKNQDTSN